MDFAFTDEQKLLSDSVGRFVQKDYGFEARRKIMAGEAGWSREHWRQFAELGWLGIPFSEAEGGLGGGPVDAAVILEQFGKGLVLEPYLATVVLGGGLLSLGGRHDLLPALAEGKTQLAVAFVERQARYNLADVETKAERRGSAFALTGAKGVCFNAEAADWIVVPARTAGASRDARGISLFLVPKGAKGLSLRGYRTVDGLRAAEVSLESVSVAGIDAILGEVDEGLPILEQAIDSATAALCAEAAGIMEHLVWTTRDYLKTRQQFGVPLSSFQALQHRATEMFILAEQAKSMAYMAAVKCVARDPEERRRAVSAAKAWVGRAGRKLGQEAIQMHGGMGMTDEMPVTHYFKRLTMIDTMFGDAAWHRRRFAHNTAAGAEV